MKINLIGRPQLVPKSKIRRLAGLRGRDPIFAQCSVCKKFQVYDSNRYDDPWLPKERLVKLVATLITYNQDLVRKSDRNFPGISDTYCPPCYKKAVS
jgi:hypothetical protein